MRYSLICKLVICDEWSRVMDVLYFLEDGHGNIRGYQARNLPSRQRRRIMRLAA